MDRRLFLSLGGAGWMRLASRSPRNRVGYRYINALIQAVQAA